MHYAGLLYRALNPVWARQPLSGEGAARFGGRFNRIGRAALYTSLAPDTTIREANRVGVLQPTVLVALRADIGPLLDGTDPAALAEHDATPQMLADPAWAEAMARGRPVPTQALAERLVAAGFAGMLVPSYARGAPADALNLVLWRWDGALTLVDDEGRLR
ncbi:RES domain-containing protein (plasmid) [Croceibacterium sp. TMG7-5b_MA50]|uniref:RES family NAD+ phosphorylase n=1 Tax=Croceibacterium sp. TMG7-5b_MA50 TaxID=3121290 RepID=UPI00322212D4